MKGIFLLFVVSGLLLCSLADDDEEAMEEENPESESTDEPASIKIGDFKPNHFKMQIWKLKLQLIQNWPHYSSIEKDKIHLSQWKSAENEL